MSDSENSDNVVERDSLGALSLAGDRESLRGRDSVGIRSTMGTIKRRATSKIRSLVNMGNYSGDRASSELELDGSQCTEEDNEARERKKLTALATVDRLKEEFKKAEDSYLEKLEQLVAFFDEVESISKQSSADSDPAIKMPEDLRLKYKFVFGNIKAIYEFHKFGFTQDLKAALDSSDAKDLFDLITKRKQKLKWLYSKYYINKPRSDLIITQHKPLFQVIENLAKFREISFRFDDKLIQPIQHIPRFPVYLEQLVKASKAAEEGANADFYTQIHQVCHDIATTANNMMEAGRMEDYEGDITQQGSLVHRGNVKSCQNGKKQNFQMFRKSHDYQIDSHIFFFEQTIVITQLSKKDHENDTHKFLQKFNINNMKVKDTGRGGPYSFEIQQANEDRPSLTIICDSDEDKKLWLSKINASIKQLVDLVNVLGDPTRAGI